MNDGEYIQSRRPRDLELRGGARQRQDREGPHGECELQRIRTPREQGGTTVRDQERQDRSYRHAQDRSAEAPSPVIGPLQRLASSLSRPAPKRSSHEFF